MSRVIRAVSATGSSSRRGSIGPLKPRSSLTPRLPDERYLHALGADVLIDEKAEQAASLDGRHHRARGGGRSAIDRVDAGAGAQTPKKACGARFGALALQHGRVEAERSRGIGEPLPVSAVAGED